MGFGGGGGLKGRKLFASSSILRYIPSGCASAFDEDACVTAVRRSAEACSLRASRAEKVKLICELDLGSNMAEKASAEDGGGRGAITDIGRWSEKKDARARSRKALAMPKERASELAHVVALGAVLKARLVSKSLSCSTHPLILSSPSYQEIASLLV